MTRRTQAGYAMLVTLVVVALAAVVAALAFASVDARLKLVLLRPNSRAADEALDQSLREACDVLRLHPTDSSGTSAGHEGATHWSASWQPLATNGSGWQTLSLESSSTVGTSRRRLGAIIELRGESCAEGVLVGTDAEFTAPCTVTGSGFYCGGSLRGREWLAFEPAASALDAVHPDRWPRAAAHELGGIWADGTEIHDLSPATMAPSAQAPQTWSFDTDTHTTSETTLYELTQPPDPELLCTLRDGAIDPGSALENDTLDLSRLPSGDQTFDTGAASGGCVLFLVPASDSQITITGDAPVGVDRLTIVVIGDCVVGKGSEGTQIRGSLIVTHCLTVASPLVLSGHLNAHCLRVSALTRIEVPDDWRHRLSPGLACPVVVAVEPLEPGETR